MRKKNYDALGLTLALVIGAIILGLAGMWKVSSIIGKLGENQVILILVAFGLFYVLAKRQRWL